MEYTKRQIEIIVAATELIHHGGIQKLTTKALAEKMGFSEPAIYRHFENKTDILVSVLRYYQLELKTKLDEILRSDTKGSEKLEQIIAFQFRHFSEHPAIVMVIFAETSFQYEEQLSSAVRDIMTNKKQLIIQVVDEGKKDGSIRQDIPSGQLATIFMGSLRFTVLDWRLSHFDDSLITKGAALAGTMQQLMKPHNS
ncbi:TetR/AcrR family transcriptional regulator [Crocinitomicaceae bacterium]|nr:TetR/AcrR family transcriptional regulator [Crocinitomicaceae bacterium]